MNLQRTLKVTAKTLLAGAALSAIGIIAFSGLTVIGARLKVQLPFTPVPMTHQCFSVLLAGIILGSSAGALSQLVYVVFGMVGLPVFAGGAAGLTSLLGPTGGYLIGFIIAPLIVGWLFKKLKRLNLGSHLLATLLSLELGLWIIYIFGISQLAFVCHLNISQAFQKGILPFLIDDQQELIAALLASFAYYKFRVPTNTNRDTR